MFPCNYQVNLKQNLWNIAKNRNRKSKIGLFLCQYTNMCVVVWRWRYKRHAAVINSIHKHKLYFKCALQLPLQNPYYLCNLHTIGTHHLFIKLNLYPFVLQSEPIICLLGNSSLFVLRCTRPWRNCRENCVSDWPEKCNQMWCFCVKLHLTYYMLVVRTLEHTAVVH